MGAFLEKPKTDKTLEHGEGNGLRYGVASMQGWRVNMEDAHMAKTNLGGTLADWSYFAVFDGHAGARVSAHCAENLLDAIVAGEFQEDVIKGIHNGFLKLDNNMRELLEVSSDKSGTTAVCAFVSPRQIFIANCGDSRAVLSRSGNPVFTTQDHKPNLPLERARIMDAGGSVLIQRVNGTLAVSRALGDYVYKNVKGRGPCEQLVSPEPEIFEINRDEEEYEFMVLACDGIWDVISNKQLCQYIHSRLMVTDNLEEVTSDVIDTCLYKGSRDNMSIVLVVFPGAPKPTPEAIQANKELEANVERRMKEIIDDVEYRCRLTNFVTIMEQLSSEFDPDLIQEKSLFIHRTFKELCREHSDSDLDA
ncbi:PREDICTED: protein phosphatase 1A [Nicrophorus vespilloides]|uniref:Protein phosphatase 1A n=1 Tax=Nicrophorus vespilloides TaxID=110193 RepID=A0ABM1N3I5_NICVS|nr:PREDICTED: protein phosphatase 1A [Nicrophorus vespilloides]XP_017781387.1 PREDICTED: protein phosphatase 1A [Nicrophorus vespilloides]